MTDTIEFSIEKVQHSKLSQTDLSNPSFGKDYSDHMFISDYVNGSWQDMRIVPFGDLSLSPANAALHYGQSIFEGLKAQKNDNGDVVLFRVAENAKRMIASAERMCMPPVPEDLFIEAITQLVRLDKDWVPTKEGVSLYIRPFQFATDPFIGVRPSDSYSFIVITGPVGSYYSKPLRVKIETEYTRAAKGGVGAAKTAGNYAASLYPARKGQQDGYDQLIWTDGVAHEYIEECGTMNLNFVVDGTILSPKKSDSVLAGITRDSALTLARDMGIPVEERPIKVAEIIEAIEKGTLQEAYGIGTAATISQISTIGFDGIDYELPAIETRAISAKLAKALSDVKLGRIGDKHGWISKI